VDRPWADRGGCHERLLALRRHIKREGPFVEHTQRFLIKAINQPSEIGTGRLP
jgi:hypothetical protein